MPGSAARASIPGTCTGFVSQGELANFFMSLSSAPIELRDGHEEELIQALLAPSPEMTASSEAMQSEEASAENDQLSNEDEDQDEELEA